MFDRFRQIFSKPQVLTDEAKQFIKKLADSDIWILAIGLRGTPVISDINDPAAFEIIGAHRKDLSEIGDDDSVFPFNYEREGKQIFPFFDSEDSARHFLSNSGFLKVDISYFQPYRLGSGFVATPENDMFDLVLNPSCPSERRITNEERLLLRSLTSPT